MNKNGILQPSETMTPGSGFHGLMTRLYSEPGIPGMQVQVFMLVQGKDLAESRAIAEAGKGKLRRGKVIDSAEFPGAVEIHKCSDNSVADDALRGVALAFAGLLPEEKSAEEKKPAETAAL